MPTIFDSFIDGLDSFFAWLSTSLKQTTESYCELETADVARQVVAQKVQLPPGYQLVWSGQYEYLHAPPLADLFPADSSREANRRTRMISLSL